MRTGPGLFCIVLPVAANRRGRDEKEKEKRGGKYVNREKTGGRGRESL